MKKKGKDNNVDTFNILTHYNGSVDVELFKTLITDFHNYTMFRKFIDNDTDIEDCIEVKDGNILFPLKFKNKKKMESFISENKGKVVECDGTSYTTKINKRKDCMVNIHFE